MNLMQKLDQDFAKYLGSIPKPDGLSVIELTGLQTGNDDIALSMLTPEQLAEGDLTAERR